MKESCSAYFCLGHIIIILQVYTVQGPRSTELVQGLALKCTRYGGYGLACIEGCTQYQYMIHVML